MASGNLENIEPHQFQPGNPGGPGRTPSKLPTFFRALVEADDPVEVQRLVTNGMRNPVIAAKLRAIQSADEDLANKASEQLVDRVFGRARQTVEHAGELSVRVSLLDALKSAEETT